MAQEFYEKKDKNQLSTCTLSIYPTDKLIKGKYFRSSDWGYRRNGLLNVDLYSTGNDERDVIQQQRLLPSHYYLRFTNRKRERRKRTRSLNFPAADRANPGPPELPARRKN